MPDLVLAFGLVAAVLMITALASGVVERSPLSFALLFLGLGIALHAADVVDIDAHSPALEAVAALTLALVLLLDAARLQLDELGRRWVVPTLILGPGTALIMLLGALPIGLLLDVGWLVAFMGGAVLASTDPVVLREIVRDERIPRSVRQVLKLEAGLNDIVVLPILLVLIAVAQHEAEGSLEWAAFGLKLLVVGPAIGFVVGGAGAWAMERVDARIGIRREYQALYGIGLVLAAYSAATAADGDGFLAAFAAGLAVVLLNRTLCDCFLDFGEVMSEMAMLLAFTLFGAVLAGMLGDVPLGAALVIAAVAVFVARPLVISLVLARARLSWPARSFIAWFGPRGLSSLLLALLVVQAGVEDGELLLAVVGVVVLASAAVHGASAPVATAWYARLARERTLAEEREGTALGLLTGDPNEVARMSVDELRELLAGERPPLIIDVRSRSAYEQDGARIPGDVRVLPDRVSTWAAEYAQSDYDRERLVVAYCT